MTAKTAQKPKEHVSNRKEGERCTHGHKNARIDDETRKWNEKDAGRVGSRDKSRQTSLKNFLTVI